jgi:hypothetical protein
MAATRCTVEPEEDDDDGDDSSGATSGGSSGDTSGSGPATEEFLCCLNGAFFECPDESAFLRCGNNLDPAECVRDESRDDDCAEF